MPYKDPDKQRAYVKNSRERFNQPSIMEKPRLYYVVQTPQGPEISNMYGGTNTICGPATFLDAVTAYVRAGGLAIDLYLEA